MAAATIDASPAADPGLDGPVPARSIGGSLPAGLRQRGKLVSRRALRSGEVRGSNEALNALVRTINAELAGTEMHLLHRACSTGCVLFGSVEQFGKVLDTAYGAVRPDGNERFKDLPEGSEAFGVAEDDLSSFGQVLVKEIQDFGFA
jgi:hypothetical protein